MRRSPPCWLGRLRPLIEWHAAQAWANTWRPLATPDPGAEEPRLLELEEPAMLEVAVVVDDAFDDAGAPPPHAVSDAATTAAASTGPTGPMTLRITKLAKANEPAIDGWRPVWAAQRTTTCRCAQLVDRCRLIGG